MSRFQSKRPPEAMDAATIEEIVVYNMEKAERMLVDAKAALSPETSVNRAYYVVFYATTALLATEGKTGRSHSGLRETFGKDFVHPCIVPKELSTLYGKLEMRRYQADYGDRIILTDEDAQESIAQAQEFLRQIFFVLQRIMPKTFGGKHITF
ncbi:MAG: HEPN domain-containing protein [Synergistaceae bacterium]|jgi:uncharacterized protein (UPF0332 family)|nr:HEPN domain-containing protein [Synergistaceae bacterium]